MYSGDITITKKVIKYDQFTQICEAVDGQGEAFYAKIIKDSKIQQMGLSQTIDFNREVLSIVEELPFKQNFLNIVEELSNQTLICFVTNTYEKNLEEYIKSKSINEKQALQIFDHILKAVYSLYSYGYWHANVRPVHFVKAGKFWKLESLVFDNDISKSQGITSEYLWSSEYQAPECYAAPEGKTWQDEQLKLMVVWNLGSIILDMLLTTHKLKNKAVLDKFVGEPFSMEKLGIGAAVTSKFSLDLRNLLGRMLHHNPKKRMTLDQLFREEFFSKEVSKLAKLNKVNPPSKIPGVGSSMLRTHKLNSSNILQLAEINRRMNAFEAQKQKLMSKAKDKIQNDDQFNEMIIQSTSIRPVKSHAKKQEIKEKNINLEEYIQNVKKGSLKYVLQLYKCYHDRSELLSISADKFDDLHYPQNQKQLRLLNKYAVSFMSLLNIHLLAESFNKNTNIFKLDEDSFQEFQNSQYYPGFARVMNFRKEGKIKQVQQIKMALGQIKKKQLCKDPAIAPFLEQNYRTATIQIIKGPYRKILKKSYDIVSASYNDSRHSKEGSALSHLAMYVTYCMTVDKLYIQEDITDNFQFYFKWMKQEPIPYVPVQSFKRYIDTADESILIENSRYILEKYYNI